MGNKAKEDARPDDEEIEIREENTDQFFIRQVGTASLGTPEQHQIAVGNAEAWFFEDLKDWKDENGKDYEQLVNERLRELQEMFPKDRSLQQREWALFKFRLINSIYRQKKPRFLRGKFT